MVLDKNTWNHITVCEKIIIIDSFTVQGKLEVSTHMFSKSFVLIFEIWFKSHLLPSSMLQEIMRATCGSQNNERENLFETI